MKRKAQGLGAATALLWLCACTCPSIRALDPAVLVNPSEQDRVQLSRIVGKALNRPPILLAPDVLTVESTLIVEPVRPRDPSGLPLNGRELGLPERFKLAKAGARCFLIQERTGKRWRLHQNCRATPALAGLHHYDAASLTAYADLLTKASSIVPGSVSEVVRALGYFQSVAKTALGSDEIQNVLSVALANRLGFAGTRGGTNRSRYSADKRFR